MIYEAINKNKYSFLGLVCNGLSYAMMYGQLFVESTPVTGRTEYDPITFDVDTASPYAAGGMIFTYPAGVFSVAPCVIVQVQVPSAIADTTFIATVSANSTTGVTVMVYKLTSSGGVPTMVEADTPDNVTVNLYAAGG